MVGTATFIALILLTAPAAAADQTRTVTVDGLERSYRVHVPPSYDPSTPTPVVLILHGAATNDVMTVEFTGMNHKADEAGFIAVYPRGSGKDPILTWNSGGWHGPLAGQRPDDVTYIASVLDDLESVLNVDKKRIFATGLSNGGMMCYRLAAELSDRIAAIAPIAGTMSLEDARPTRPVPVMHFHGTADRLVPPQGSDRSPFRFFSFLSLEQTIQTWCRINGCTLDPVIDRQPNTADDGTVVIRKTYRAGESGAEIVLFQIRGGGHTWPGRPSPLPMLGLSTRDISANDLMWEFFQKHPLR